MNNLIRICISAYLNNSPKKIDAAFSCVHSLLCQTYDNYEIYILHDGPVNDSTLADNFRKFSDMIVFIDNFVHMGNWGFYHRHNISLLEPHADWIIYTNEDNYYVPTFLEKMINTAMHNKTKMVYCDMIHSHHDWNLFCTYPAECGIDMGAFMSHIDLIKNMKKGS